MSEHKYLEQDMEKPALITGTLQTPKGTRRVEVPANWNTGRIALTVYQVAVITGMGVSTVWRRVKLDPEFPHPRVLSPQRTAWYSDEVAEWMNRAPVDFGRGEAFRDMVWRSFAHSFRYRQELLAYCVRTGVVTPRRVENLLDSLGRFRFGGSS